MAAEAEADLDSLIGHVELEGEDEPEVGKKDDAKPDAEKSDKAEPDTKEGKAEKINKRIEKALEKHLANPELPCLLVDILDPGTATVNLNLPDLTPWQHFLIAFGGIMLAAVATNPEVLAKLKNGLKRKDGKGVGNQKQAKLPAGAAPAKEKEEMAAPSARGTPV
jgi:hypothetical protein